MTAEEFRRWAAPFPDALMLVRRTGEIRACNSALSALLMQSEESIASKTLFDFAPGSPECVQSALRLWAGSGQMVYGPLAFEVEKAGKLRCEGALIRSSAADSRELLIVRVKRHEVATARFVALNRKIDELSGEIRLRQRSEEEVRRQREWFQVTLSSIGDAVIATDVHGAIEFMNGSAEGLTGWSLAEARAQPMAKVFEIFSEIDRGVVENPVYRVLTEGRVVGLANHTVLRSRDGTERPIEDSAAPIRDSDGKLIGVVLVFHDVSDKKKAHAALLASERRFRLWTELNVIAAGVSDFVGSFLEANDALLHLLGFSRQGLEAGKLGWHELTPPEHAERDLRALAEARERGACQPYEKEFFHQDGHRVPVIIGYALFREAGRYPKQQSEELGICFIVDISERKRAEDLLEKRVAERTARLQTALADLEAFSYTISHDLRAPLRSMQTYAQFLLEDHGASLNGEAAEFVQKIIRSGEHLDKLIQDVLTYSRVSKSNVPMGRIDPGKLMAELVECYPNFAARNVRIEIAPDLPHVRGNDALFTQCFANLVGNAIKFVPAGRTPRVRIGADLEGTRLRLWVQDNGIGIAASDYERIFGIFERGSIAKEYEGTGIGLSIVRRAVEKMDGKLGVESVEGEGSRFWVELERA